MVMRRVIPLAAAGSCGVPKAPGGSRRDDAWRWSPGLSLDKKMLQDVLSKKLWLAIVGISRAVAQGTRPMTNISPAESSSPTGRKAGEFDRSDTVPMRNLERPYFERGIVRPRTR